MQRLLRSRQPCAQRWERIGLQGRSDQADHALGDLRPELTALLVLLAGRAEDLRGSSARRIRWDGWRLHYQPFAEYTFTAHGLKSEIITDLTPDRLACELDTS